jgi:N-dimethylarginine dimethylaminohydrolase
MGRAAMSASLNEYATIQLVMVKHPREAFVSQTAIAGEWRGLNFSAPPDLPRAINEYDRFLEIVGASGAEMIRLPVDSATTLDSIYARDASIVSARGIITCSMGKPQRAGEPCAQERELRRLGVPPGGSIHLPGRLEGGDVVWLDEATLAVGEGRRTNAEGIRQLAELVGDTVDVITVPLPDYPGLHDVMHLMSLISPIDRDLAVVYSRLLPHEFSRTLANRGYTFVDVPDEEFETMAANVLAIGPRRCVMLDGNPLTRARLERAGASVDVYDGREISAKGGGGPTCLTRPLRRGAR